jgi:radial spoke head protein 1
MSDEEDDEETKYTIVYEGDETIYKAVDRDGIATATFENGDTYVGMYKDQKRNGAGVYTYTSKNMKYEGEYLENKKEGHGRMTYQDGGIFEGGWKDNERHGMGTYFYPNGDSYSGEWKNGKKNGIGKYVFADNGSTMSGTWVANRCVSGVWGMSDRSRYVGRFANNVPSVSSYISHIHLHTATCRVVVCLFSPIKTNKRVCFVITSGTVTGSLNPALLNNLLLHLRPLPQHGLAERLTKLSLLSITLKAFHNYQS